MCSTKKYPSGNFVGNLQKGFLKRKPFPLPHRCCCFPPQCLGKNMNKRRVYTKIPKDYPDQQNIGMCAPVCIHTHTTPKQTSLQKTRHYAIWILITKGYISNSYCFCTN